MGIFTSKIALGVLAGGITLGGAGVCMFTGTDTLDKASAYVTNSSERIIQFASKRKVID